MLNEFKTRKLAEFQEKFCYGVVLGSTMKDGDELWLKTEKPDGIKQFISDLIDEMTELNHPFFKADMETGEITELEPGKIETLTNLNS